MSRDEWKPWGQRKGIRRFAVDSLVTVQHAKASYHANASKAFTLVS